MDKKKKVKEIIKILEERYPDAECSLVYDGEPWKLLVSSRLSAQCTDERVNIVTAELFRAFPTLESLAAADISEIEKYIRSCGLYHSKAKNIKDACNMLISDFGGRVPDTMEELLRIPGVGRKIANLILGDIFGKGGIVADTHCIRISNRLGLASKADPLNVERELSKLMPREVQSDFCHRIVWFGRDVCCARNPKCDVCPIGEEKLCDFGKKK